MKLSLCLSYFPSVLSTNHLKTQPFSGPTYIHFKSSKQPPTINEPSPTTFTNHQPSTINQPAITHRKQTITNQPTSTNLIPTSNPPLTHLQPTHLPSQRRARRHPRLLICTLRHRAPLAAAPSLSCTSKLRLLQRRAQAWHPQDGLVKAEVKVRVKGSGEGLGFGLRLGLGVRLGLRVKVEGLRLVIWLRLMSWVVSWLARWLSDEAYWVRLPAGVGH